MDGDDLDHSPMAQFTYDNRNFETKLNLHIVGVIIAKMPTPKARSIVSVLANVKFGIIFGLAEAHPSKRALTSAIL
jgi:hypothetical protein